MKKLVVILCLVLLALLTLFPRSVELLNGNYIFGFDQGREYLSAKKIAYDHKLTLIGTELGAGSAGLSGLFHGPVYYYILSLLFIFSAGNPYGGMVLMFLFSIGTVVWGFLLGKKLFGFYGGLVVAFLIAASPPFISHARILWSPNPPSFFIIPVFYFLFLFLKETKLLHLFLASFLSGFIYNFEFAIAVPLSFSVLIFLLILKTKNLKHYLVWISGVILALSPMLLFELRHNFMGIRGFFTYALFDRSTEITRTFIFLAIDHWNTFLFSFADTFPGRGLLNLNILLFIFGVLAIYYIKREKNREIKIYISYLLLLPILTFFVFMFLKNAVYHYYLTQLNVAYIIIFTFILINSIKKRTVFYLMFAYFLILIFTGMVDAVKVSLYDYNDYGGTAKIAGKKDALDFIYKDAGNKQFNLLIFSPPVYTYPYDYLLWWYGKPKYGFIPGNKKEGTFYLLMEPDPSKPWSHKGWLETVIKDGKVIYTKELPSGFIIQKRIK